MLFNILKGDPIKDFYELIESLHTKFKFKNKENFKEDLFNMIININVGDKNVDIEKVENDFFQLIAEHSTESDLSIQFDKAEEEIRNLLWQQK